MMKNNTTTNASKPLLTIILPVYRGAEMLDNTFTQILALEQKINARLEIIAVDDGSDDNSFAKITTWRERHPDKIRAIRLSRNYGSMAAIQAGLDHARGDCVSQLPQDLQDTPESVIEMFMTWQAGAQINMLCREGQRDEPFIKKTTSAIYHFIFSILSNVRDYPRGGFGTFLIDRQIVERLTKHPRRHADIITHIFTIGGARLHFAQRLPPKSKSNWTFAKNVKLVIDNFIGFSYMPVRLMSLAGIIVALSGFCFAGYVFIGRFTEWGQFNQPPGWATIVVLLVFLSGMMMLMLGVIGEYLWRILDEVRGEPSYQIAENYDKNHDENHDKLS